MDAMINSLVDFLMYAFAYLLVLGFAAIPVNAAIIVIALARGWFSLSDIFDSLK